MLKAHVRHSWPAFFCGLATACIGFATSDIAVAQSTVYWDIDGATPGPGGTTPSGTWSSIAANWSPSPAGDAATAGWVSGTGPGDGNVAFFSSGTDATGSFAVTVDGTNFASGMVVNQGTVNLSGTGVVAFGSGTVRVAPGAALGMNSLFRVTQTSGGKLVLDGATLLSTNTSNAISIWPAQQIQLTANGGTISYNVGNNSTFFTGTFLGEGGTTSAGAQTLTKTGTSELRVQGVATANYTFEKLKVLGGLYRIGSSTNTSGQLSTETGFGAIPSGQTADAITLDGGAIGASFNLTLDSFRGITLGANGGVLNTTAATLVIPGPIAGSGPLRVIGKGLTLNGANTSTGGMIIGSDIAMVGGITTTTGGTVTLAADFNIGAVPGALDPTNVRLGTDTAAGYLTVSADAVFPATRGFRVGAAGGTLSTTRTVTLAGPLGGPGAFIKTSSGTLTLTGSSTITGGITSWGGGMLEIASDASLGAVSGTLQPAALTLAGATTSGRVRALDTFTLSANRGITINVGGTTASPLGGTIDVATDKTLTVAGPITGAGRLTKAGAGTLVLAGSNSFAGTATVSSGTLVAGGVMSGTAGVTVASGATLVLGVGNALSTRAVTPSPGGTMKVSPAVQATVGGLAVSASSGLVDVGSGMVTVAAGLTAPTMVTAILTGMGDGTWNGTSGITSSVAATSGGDRTVGWLDNGDGSVTFAFAAPGDTNLDWMVDSLDQANFLAGGKLDSGQPATWNEGDFTYDGFVDILDAAAFTSTGLFDAGTYNSAPAAGGVAAVPEPATWGAWATLAAVAAARRGRLRRRLFRRLFRSQGSV